MDLDLSKRAYTIRKGAADEIVPGLQVFLAVDIYCTTLVAVPGGRISVG